MKITFQKKYTGQKITRTIRDIHPNDDGDGFDGSVLVDGENELVWSRDGKTNWIYFGY